MRKKSRHADHEAEAVAAVEGRAVRFQSIDDRVQPNIAANISGLIRIWSSLSDFPPREFALAG